MSSNSVIKNGVCCSKSTEEEVLSQNNFSQELSEAIAQSDNFDDASVVSTSRHPLLARCISLPPKFRSESIPDVNADLGVQNAPHPRTRSVGCVEGITEGLMPCFVISDYSGESDQNSDSIPLSEEVGLTIDDIINCQPPRRKLSTGSNSSLTSTLSNFSFDDDPLIENNHADCSPPKPSQWRKVRNCLHWAPFIQTYKKHKYPWVQLAGHQGNFKSSGHGTILKKLCGQEEVCFEKLMKDKLCPYIPQYKGKAESDDGTVFLELEDLLSGFESPCIMDVKMGVRTYLEDELSKAREKPKLRKDMYEKMVQIDPTEPTDEEHSLKAITKPRYMIWRETISSTATLGFRIEGIKKSDGTTSKDFKTIKTKGQVSKIISQFTDSSVTIVKNYLQRLQLIKSALDESEFFKSHELIGSSLLFVHDAQKAAIWLIDFAKTFPVPEELDISHKNLWQVGNHEDGYVTGVENLLSILNDLEKQLHSSELGS